jgi:hypothetical protein
MPIKKVPFNPHRLDAARIIRIAKPSIVEKSRNPSSIEYGASVGAYCSKIKSSGRTIRGMRRNADGIHPHAGKWMDIGRANTRFAGVGIGA